MAEMCAVYCLPLVTTPLSDDECELAYVVLKEFTKSLTPMAVQRLVLPSIQKILLVRLVPDGICKSKLLCGNSINILLSSINVF